MRAASVTLRDAVVKRLRAAGCAFAEDEADLLLAHARDRRQLAELVDQRIGGRPVETILGWAEFAGRRIAVAPGVFVPRQRTVALVEQAASRTPPGAVVVDLGCGSGAIARILLDRIDALEVHAVDADPTAVVCARTNLPPPTIVYEGDLFEPLPDRLRGRVATIVANVPYVPTEQIARMPPEAREHEPRSALDGGPDGLDVVRRVAAEAGDWLARGGFLLIETGPAQIPVARRVLRSAGLTDGAVHDEERAAEVVIGRRR